jgi:hypothetical protein
MSKARSQAHDRLIDRSQDAASRVSCKTGDLYKTLISYIAQRGFLDQSPFGAAIS